MSALDRLKQV
jgi:hypothetical protein